MWPSYLSGEISEPMASWTGEINTEKPDVNCSARVVTDGSAGSDFPLAKVALLSTAIRTRAQTHRTSPIATAFMLYPPPGQSAFMACRTAHARRDNYD
jgi:hypothetical protein